MVAIGERFTVSKPREVKDKKGRTRANYLPQYDYRVTPLNLAIVTEMIAAGDAVIRGSGGRANAVAAKPVIVKGTVKVGAKKRGVGAKKRGK